MSALLTLQTFEERFPQVVVDPERHDNHATLQSFVVAVYVRLLISLSSSCTGINLNADAILRNLAVSRVHYQISGLVIN